MDMHMRQTRRTRVKGNAQKLHLVPWTSLLASGLGREKPRSQGRSPGNKVAKILLLGSQLQLGPLVNERISC